MSHGNLMFWAVLTACCSFFIVILMNYICFQWKVIPSKNCIYHIIGDSWLSDTKDHFNFCQYLAALVLLNDYMIVFWDHHLQPDMGHFQSEYQPLKEVHHRIYLSFVLYFVFVTCVLCQYCYNMHVFSLVVCVFTFILLNFRDMEKERMREREIFH